MASPLLVAKNDKAQLALLPGLANRHGLVTGATGTGKTVTVVERAFIVPPGSRGVLGSILGGKRR